MFGKQEDIFPDDSKQKNKQIREELKQEKEEEKREKEEEKKKAEEIKRQKAEEARREKEQKAAQKRTKKKTVKGDIWEDEPDQNLDKVVKVSDLPETLDEKSKVTAKSVFGFLLLAILVVGSGFVAAFVAGFFNAVPFSIQGQWPLIVSTDIFMLSTIGFFSTEGKIEKVYGLFSIVSVACFIVELIIMFN